MVNYANRLQEKPPDYKDHFWGLSMYVTGHSLQIQLFNMYWLTEQS